LAGFSNARILSGDVVPTPPDILEVKGVTEIRVPGIVDVLERHRPGIILLMSGTNGFDARARNRLIRTIGKHSAAHLIVATIPPIRPGHVKHKHVAGYNRSLPSIVEAQRRSGKRISMVDMHATISLDQLTDDGVHPGKEAMQKMAEAWFEAVKEICQRPGDVAMPRLRTSCGTGRDMR
jgi:lysophospholipase L1-like esterase